MTSSPSQLQDNRSVCRSLKSKPLALNPFSKLWIRMSSCLYEWMTLWYANSTHPKPNSPAAAPPLMPPTSNNCTQFLWDPSSPFLKGLQQLLPSPESNPNSFTWHLGSSRTSHSQQCTAAPTSATCPGSCALAHCEAPSAVSRLSLLPPVRFLWPTP